MTALQRFCRVLLLIILLGILPSTILAGALHWLLGGLVFLSCVAAMARLSRRLRAAGPLLARDAAWEPTASGPSADADSVPREIRAPTPAAAAKVGPEPLANVSAGATTAAAPIEGTRSTEPAVEALPAPAPGPERVPLRARRGWIAAAAVVVLVSGLRLYRLDDLQGEWYGDISTLYEYTEAVRHLDFPADFYNLGVGPLYPFILWPLLAALGTSYLSIKASAVLISLAGLGALFLWCRRLEDTPFALVATAVAGTGSWLLVYSRLGDVEAAVLLFTMGPLALAARVIESPSQRGWSAALCGLMAGSCAYLYGAAFMVPVLVTMLLTTGYLTSPLRPAKRSDLLVYLVTLSLVLAPLAVSYARAPKVFAEGHFATRLIRGPGALTTVASNLGEALLAYVTRGDDGFRGNPPGVPHIDRLTLVLAIVGCVFWLLPARRKWGAALIGGFLLMHLPSTLVSSLEVPSAARTIAAAPFAYILAASGIWWPAQGISRRFGSALALSLVVVLVAAVTLINTRRYFVRYIAGLPYQNTHIARAITTFVDLLPAETEAHLVEAPWSPGGMPEPKSIRYQMQHPDNLVEETSASMNCARLRSIPRPAVLIWSYEDALPSPSLAECSDSIHPQLFRSDRDLPLFQAALLRELAAGARDQLPTLPWDTDERPAGASDFLQAEVQVNRRAAELLYQPIDMGEPVNAFDGDPRTLMRGAIDNPYRLELRFLQPIEIGTIALDLGFMPEYEVEIRLLGPDGDETTVSMHDRPTGGDSPHVEIAVPDGPVAVTVARVSIKDIREEPGEGWHIHVFGLHLQ